MLIYIMLQGDNIKLYSVQLNKMQFQKSIGPNIAPVTPVVRFSPENSNGREMQTDRQRIILRSDGPH